MNNSLNILKEWNKCLRLYWSQQMAQKAEDAAISIAAKYDARIIGAYV
ncbi:MAG: hypothetical protein PQ975_10660 [Methanobacterium sp.]